MARVLLSAYACDPDHGSEPGAGYAALRAAARQHTVVVLTRSKNAAAIEAAIRAGELPESVEVVPFDLGRVWRSIKRGGRSGLNLYYIAWQLFASRHLRRTNAWDGIDVAHHATFANANRPVVIPPANVPMVWGPVGGFVDIPRGTAYIRVLGCRGLLTYFGRTASRRAMGPIVRLMLRRNIIVALAQNGETASRLSWTGHVQIVPNALSVGEQPPQPSKHPVKHYPRPYFLVLGELRPMKGGVLAVRSFARLPDATNALLVFAGSGSREQHRLANLAEELGVGRNVVFAGRLERTEVFDLLQSSAALVSCSLHDESSFATAEALALGVPVLTLAHGGAYAVCSSWGAIPSHCRAVQPEPRGIELAIASAMDSLLAAPKARAPMVPTHKYSCSLLQAYDAALRLPVKRGLK